MEGRCEVAQDYISKNGKINCRRCQARSSRHGSQCGRPALRGKKVCQFHGGLGGPKTAEGRDRIAVANTTHGRASKESRARLARFALLMARLESLAAFLDMTSGQKARGRKPRGLTSIESFEQAVALAGILIHRDDER